MSLDFWKENTRLKKKLFDLMATDFFSIVEYKLSHLLKSDLIYEWALKRPRSTNQEEI